MHTGLFLDRDGVINRELGAHTVRFEDFEILPGVPEAIAAATSAGWTVVVITNQSGINLGLYGHATVERMHAYLAERLLAHQTQVAGIFYCPHHPQHGRCLCRKPGGLLLQRAVARYGLDPIQSVMIGDRERDVQAAVSVGIRGIRVPANAVLLDTLRANALL